MTIGDEKLITDAEPVDLDYDKVLDQEIERLSLSNAELLRLAADPKNRPPQSWFDEDANP